MIDRRDVIEIDVHYRIIWAAEEGPNLEILRRRITEARRYCKLSTTSQFKAALSLGPQIDFL